MAQVVIGRFSGDKYAAKGLWKYGLAQLDLLKESMRFQGLQQNRRQIILPNGATITCKSCHGIHTVDIFFPEAAVPSGGIVEEIIPQDVFIAYSTNDEETEKAYDLASTTPREIKEYKQMVPIMDGQPANYATEQSVLGLLKTYTYNLELDEDEVAKHSVTIYHKKGVSLHDLLTGPGETGAYVQMESIEVYHDCPDSGQWVSVTAHAVNFWVNPDGSFTIVRLDLEQGCALSPNSWRYVASVDKYSKTGELISTVSYPSFCYPDYTLKPRWGATVAYDGDLDLIYTNAWDGEPYAPNGYEIVWSTPKVVQTQNRLYDYDPVKRRVVSMETLAAANQSTRNLWGWGDGIQCQTDTTTFCNGGEWFGPGFPDPVPIEFPRFLCNAYGVGWRSLGYAFKRTGGEDYFTKELIRNKWLYEYLHAWYDEAPCTELWYATARRPDYQYPTGDDVEIRIPAMYRKEETTMQVMLPAVISYWDFVNERWQYFDYMTFDGFSGCYEKAYHDPNEPLGGRLFYYFECYYTGAVNRHHIFQVDQELMDASVQVSSWPSGVMYWDSYMNVSADEYDGPYPQDVPTGAPEPYIPPQTSVDDTPLQPYKIDSFASVPVFTVLHSIGAYQRKPGISEDPEKPYPVRTYLQTYVQTPGNDPVMQAYTKKTGGELQSVNIPVEPKRWTSNGAILQVVKETIRRRQV